MVLAWGRLYLGTSFLMILTTLKFGPGSLGQPQVVTHPGQYHVLDWCRHHFFQGVGELGNDDDGLGLCRSLQLMPSSRGYRGLTFHHRHAGPQDANTAMGYCSRFGIITATLSPCRASARFWR